MSIAFRGNSIYVVEDNLADFEAVQVLLTEAGAKAEIVHFESGERLLSHLDELTKVQPASKRSLPLHILLDLNLPGLTGLDVLTELRNHSMFGAIPVTILTTSSHPKDVDSCYRAGANSYLVKPVNFERFTEIIGNFVKYWLGSVILPVYKLV